MLPLVFQTGGVSSTIPGATQAYAKNTTVRAPAYLSPLIGHHSDARACVRVHRRACPVSLRLLVRGPAACFLSDPGAAA